MMRRSLNRLQSQPSIGEKLCASTTAALRHISPSMSSCQQQHGFSRGVRRMTAQRLGLPACYPILALPSYGGASSPCAPVMAQQRSTLFTSNSIRLAEKEGGDAKEEGKKDEKGGALVGVHSIKEHKGEDDEEKKYQDEEEQEQKPHNEGYLPFPSPFHTFNIMSLLLIGNVLMYVLMNFVCNDDQRDFIVEHFTLSHENMWRVYPLLTHALYQEHLLQLAIDCWLLASFGRTLLDFLGNARLTMFFTMATLGGAALHLGRQQVEQYYGLDPLEVRGRCFGPNPFILGLVGVEGFIFRHLNFIQQPPVPFLVLTAFVVVIDIWRIFTTKPAEHGAATGGALMAYFFWALPTRMMGLNKLTASM